VQSNQYYLLTSDLQGSKYALIESDSQPFFVSPPSSQSSGHWKIFYENPVFLIQNHDSLEALQLGISEQDSTRAGMLNSTGDLRQR
jgi:hypothetical protein